jgi:hypothetical protein
MFNHQNSIHWAEAIAILFAVYLVIHFHRRDFKSWQHYACLIAVVFWVTILFLIDSDKVQSFELAGNNVKLVNQKLEEVKSLTEQNKLMAKATVELVNKATAGMIADESYDPKGTYQREVNLLRSAGFTDSEMKEMIQVGNQGATKTNSP